LRRAPTSLDAFAQRSGPDDTEAAVFAAKETEVALARIAALPPGQAEVVLLRILAGFEVADVAKIVGKKPGAVRVLQHRALQRLAEQLARDGMRVTR
jgi:RNA polymerase sigma-70 factor, ECF subfamily